MRSVLEERKFFTLKHWQFLSQCLISWFVPILHLHAASNHQYCGQGIKHARPDVQVSSNFFPFASFRHKKVKK